MICLGGIREERILAWVTGTPRIHETQGDWAWSRRERNPTQEITDSLYALYLQPSTACYVQPLQMAYRLRFIHESILRASIQILPRGHPRAGEEKRRTKPPDDILFLQIAWVTWSSSKRTARKRWGSTSPNPFSPIKTLMGRWTKASSTQIV